jgi:hypothetical protein
MKRTIVYNLFGNTVKDYQVEGVLYPTIICE